jgi:hypothetical protein
MLDGVFEYLTSIFLEGIVIGFVFWMITYITIESTSLWGAVRASLIAETVGNIPYLWELPSTSAPAMAMSLVAAILFIRLILQVGELTVAKATYGTTMTYFVMVALVTCAY